MNILGPAITDIGAEQKDANYEAPAIDSIVTPQDMEREVHYAGGLADDGVPISGA